MAKNDGFFKSRFDVQGKQVVEGKRFRKAPALITYGEKRCHGCDLERDYDRCFHAGNECLEEGFIWKEEKTDGKCS